MLQRLLSASASLSSSLSSDELFLIKKVHYYDTVSNTPGNPGNLLELFFLLEILEIFWKFAKSPGNFLAEFVCLLLL